jgi:hypothetical protein
VTVPINTHPVNSWGRMDVVRGNTHDEAHTHTQNGEKQPTPERQALSLVQLDSLDILHALPFQSCLGGGNVGGIKPKVVLYLHNFL